MAGQRQNVVKDDNVSMKNVRVFCMSRQRNIILKYYQTFSAWKEQIWQLEQRQSTFIGTACSSDVGLFFVLGVKYTQRPNPAGRGFFRSCIVVQAGEDIQVIKTTKNSLVSKIHLINANFKLFLDAMAWLI